MKLSNQPIKKKSHIKFSFFTLQPNYLGDDLTGVLTCTGLGSSSSCSELPAHYSEGFSKDMHRGWCWWHLPSKVVAMDIASISTVSKSQHHRACCWKTRHRPRRAVATSSALPTWWFGRRGSGMGSLSWAAQLGWSRAGTPPHSVQAVPAVAACGLVPSARVTQQPRWLCH